MSKFITLTSYDGVRAGDDFSILATQIAQVIPQSRGGTSYVKTLDGQTILVLDGPDTVRRKLCEADEDVQKIKQFESAKKDISDYFQTRIGNTKKRRDEGEKFAELRLSEIEDMQNFVTGRLDEING